MGSAVVYGTGYRRVEYYLPDYLVFVSKKKNLMNKELRLKEHPELKDYQQYVADMLEQFGFDG